MDVVSQQPPKCCNRMAKRTQHVAPNNVAIVWPGLYNRRRLTTKIKASASVWNSHRTSLWTRRRKTNVDSRFLMNKIIRSVLTSCKHNHRYYGHHSNFRTANFYVKMFRKRTWPPTVEEFRMISRMTWLVRHSKLQPITDHTIFSGRARDTGKFKKTRQFLTPKKTKGMRSRI